MRRNPGVALLLLVLSVAVSAQRPSADDRAAMLQSIDAKRSAYAEVARKIWDIQKAKAEFDQERGPNFVYKTRLADRKPALDYRK
jgi:hypothetical protein